MAELLYKDLRGMDYLAALALQEQLVSLSSESRSSTFCFLWSMRTITRSDVAATKRAARLLIDQPEQG